MLPRGLGEVVADQGFPVTMASHNGSLSVYRGGAPSGTAGAVVGRAGRYDYSPSVIQQGTNFRSGGRPRQTPRSSQDTAPSLRHVV